MNSVIDTLSYATDFPLSIIIVGVGHENFKNMEVLDDDQGNLRDSKGQKLKRDIVQFVPYRECGNGPALAREVLHEIPNQISAFYRTHGMLDEFDMKNSGQSRL